MQLLFFAIFLVLGSEEKGGRIKKKKKGKFPCPHNSCSARFFSFKESADFARVDEEIKRRWLRCINRAPVEKNSYAE